MKQNDKAAARGDDGVIAIRGAAGNRMGSSRKLLARKAAERAATPEGEALEDVFPLAAEPADAPSQDSAVAIASEAPAEQLADVPAVAAAGADTIGAMPNANAASAEYIEPAANAAPETSALSASEPESAPSEATPPSPPPQPTGTPAWSSEDEAALQALLARRRTASGARRGRAVGGQLIRAGAVAPNPGTVVAVIVGLVAKAGGSVSRERLIGMMAGAAFGDARAKPGDRGWCTGYVQGAVRNGHLAVGEAAQEPRLSAHSSACPDDASVSAQSSGQELAA